MNHRHDRAPAAIQLAPPRAGTAAETAQGGVSGVCDHALFIPSHQSGPESVLLRVFDEKALLSTGLLEKVAEVVACHHRERTYPLERNCLFVNGDVLLRLNSQFPGLAKSPTLLYCDGLPGILPREHGVGYLQHYVACLMIEGAFVAIDATFPIHKKAKHDLRGQAGQAVLFVAGSEEDLIHMLEQRLGGAKWEPRKPPPEEVFVNLKAIRILSSAPTYTETIERHEIDTLGREEQSRFKMHSSDPLAVEQTTCPSLRRELVFGEANWEQTSFFRSLVQRDGVWHVTIEAVNAQELLKHAELCPQRALADIADLTRFRYDDPLDDPQLPNAYRLIALQAHRNIADETINNFHKPGRYLNRKAAEEELETAENSQRYLIEHGTAAPQSIDKFDELRCQIRKLTYQQSSRRSLTYWLGKVFLRRGNPQTQQ